MPWAYGWTGRFKMQARQPRSEKPLPPPGRMETIWLALAPILGRLSLAALAALLGLYVFAKIAHEMSEAETLRFDRAVLHFFHAYSTPGFHAVMKAVSWLAGLGPQCVLVVFVVAFFALKRRFWPDGAALLVAVIGGAGLITGLKALFHRARPDTIYDRLGYSFPSGHSFFSLVIYGMIAYWLARDLPPRARRSAWTLAVFVIALVGFSRAFLGEHYPSDVAAGFAVGLFWLWGCLALPTAFHRRKRDISPEEARARYERGRARLKEAALLLPSLVRLAARLSRDPRVPVSRKVGLALLGGYLALPFDLIPDFIPILGVADDIILASVTLRWVLKAVPPEVVRAHWDGGTDLLDLLNRARAGINNLMNRD